MANSNEDERMYKTSNAISHHPLTDDLSSGPPAPGQHSPVYTLSVTLYGMG